MGALKTLPLNPNAVTMLKDEDARVVRVSSFDGLGAVQLVREWTLPERGLPKYLLAALPARLEGQPDIDVPLSATVPATDACGNQGTLRYVPNPSMGGEQFPGLYVGGPVSIERDPETNNLKCRQVLTRVRSVNFGWSINATTKKVELAVPATQVPPVANPYAAETVLLAVRPSTRTVRVNASPYRTDWPTRVRTEAKFQHFTHESMTYLDALTAAQLSTVLAHHNVLAQTWKPVEWGCAIDAETNGVVFTVLCEAKTTYTPASVADLKTQPHRVLPANRETLRAFGLRSESKGEGYAYGKVYRWTDMLPAARTFLEAPGDIAFLWTVVDDLSAAYPVYANKVLNGVFQEGGRAWKYATTTADTFAVAYAAGAFAPWWRVIEWRVEEGEDGLLTLTVHVERPEWTNNGATPDDATVTLGSPSGWGKDMAETIPSVPRADAEKMLETIPTKAGYLVAGRNAAERERGTADVGTQWLGVWSYSGQDVPQNLPTITVGNVAVTAPEIEETHATSESGAGIVCRFYRVNPANVAAVLTAAKAAVTRAAVTGDNPAAAYELRVSGVRSGDAGDLTVYAASVQYKNQITVEWWGSYTDTMIGYQDQYRRRKANTGESWAAGATKQYDCPERDEMRIARTTTYLKTTTSRTSAYAHARTEGAVNPRVQQGGNRRWYAQYDLVVYTPWFAMPETGGVPDQIGGDKDGLLELFTAHFTEATP